MRTLIGLQAFCTKACSPATRVEQGDLAAHATRCRRSHSEFYDAAGARRLVRTDVYEGSYGGVRGNEAARSPAASRVAGQRTTLKVYNKTPAIEHLGHAFPWGPSDTRPAVAVVPQEPLESGLRLVWRRGRGHQAPVTADEDDVIFHDSTSHHPLDDTPIPRSCPACPSRHLGRASAQDGLEI